MTIGPGGRADVRAADIMTAEPLTVTPQTTLKEAVTLMLTHAISGLPVLQNHELVGMVTEGDLLRRGELGSERRHSRWNQLFGNHEHQAQEYVHAHGQRVAEVMTREPMVTQCAETTHTALGLGRRAPNSVSAALNALCSIAFIGDPWPTNKTGILSPSSPVRSIEVRAELRGLPFDQHGIKKDSGEGALDYSRSALSGL